MSSGRLALAKGRRPPPPQPPPPPPPRKHHHVALTLLRADDLKVGKGSFRIRLKVEPKGRFVEVDEAARIDRDIFVDENPGLDWKTPDLGGGRRGPHAFFLVSSAAADQHKEDKFQPVVELQLKLEWRAAGAAKFVQLSAATAYLDLDSDADQPWLSARVVYAERRSPDSDPSAFPLLTIAVQSTTGERSEVEGPVAQADVEYCLDEGEAVRRACFDALVFEQSFEPASFVRGDTPKLMDYAMASSFLRTPEGHAYVDHQLRQDIRQYGVDPGIDPLFTAFYFVERYNPPARKPKSSALTTRGGKATRKLDLHTIKQFFGRQEEVWRMLLDAHPDVFSLPPFRRSAGHDLTLRLPLEQRRPTNRAAAAAADGGGWPLLRSMSRCSLDDGKDVHLLVMHSGVFGGVYEMAELAATVRRFHHPGLAVWTHYCATNLSDRTTMLTASLQTLAANAAIEVMNVVSQIESHTQQRVSHISYFGYSLGGLVLRAAIEDEQLAAFTERTHIFASFNSPHLGCPALEYQAKFGTAALSAMVCVSVARQPKASSAVSQLLRPYAAATKDEHFRASILYGFNAEARGVRHARHVILCGVIEDERVAVQSSVIVDLCDANAVNGRQFTPQIKERLNEMGRQLRLRLYEAQRDGRVRTVERVTVAVGPSVSKPHTKFGDTASYEQLMRLCLHAHLPRP